MAVPDGRRPCYGTAWPIPEERRGHGAAHDLAALEDRLQVHRFPQGTGFDTLGLQRQADVLPGGTELGRIDRDYGQVAVGPPPGRCGYETDTVHDAQMLTVSWRRERCCGGSYGRFPGAGSDFQKSHGSNGGSVDIKLSNTSPIAVKRGNSSDT